MQTRTRTHARTCIRARTRTPTQDFDKATDSIVMKSKVDIAARRYLGLKLGIPDLLHSDFLDVSTHPEYPMVVSTTGDLRLVRLSCLALLRTPENSRSTPLRLVEQLKILGVQRVPETTFVRGGRWRYSACGRS